MADMGEIAEQLDLLEDELDILIFKAYRSGLNYWQVSRIFLTKSVDLMIRSEAEYYEKGGE